MPTGVEVSEIAEGLQIFSTAHPSLRGCDEMPNNRITARDEMKIIRGGLARGQFPRSD